MVPIKMCLAWQCQAFFHFIKALEAMTKTSLSSLGISLTNAGQFYRDALGHPSECQKDLDQSPISADLLHLLP